MRSIFNVALAVIASTGFAMTDEEEAAAMGRAMFKTVTDKLVHVPITSWEKELGEPAVNSEPLDGK